MKKYPPVVVVDENDKVIGSESLEVVWQKGLNHRIVAVFILDENDRMLLQLRSNKVKLSANRWDQAAGGHVDLGQSYEDAASTELHEELGLKNIKLELLGTHFFNRVRGERIINQFERMYLARIPSDTYLRFEPEEVSELRWFSPEQLKTMISQSPDDFTAGLLFCLKEYFPVYIESSVLAQ